MRSLMVMLLLAGAARADQVMIDRERALDEVQRMSQALAQLKGALQAMGATRNPAIAQQLQQVEWHAEKLARRLGAGQAMMPPPPPPPPRLRPIDDGSFAALLAAVDNESFSQNKLQVIEQAAQSSHFLVSQLKQIVEHLSFSKDKVRSVEVVAPRLLDRQNAFQLYEAFSFSADKEKVRQILSR